MGECDDEYRTTNAEMPTPSAQGIYKAIQALSNNVRCRLVEAFQNRKMEIEGHGFITLLYNRRLLLLCHASCIL